MKFALLFMIFSVLLSHCGFNQQYTESELKELGVLVSQQGNVSIWRIPLATAKSEDQMHGIELVMDHYVEELEELKEAFARMGIPEEALSNNEEFRQKTKELIQNILESNEEEPISGQVPETQDFERMTNWKSYSVPQAFMVMFGAKFGMGIGAKGGVKATLVMVVQPWLKIRLDNSTGEILSKNWELLPALYAIPNLSIGIGAEGGPSWLAGVGAVFGPLKNPDQLKGVAIGASATAGLSLQGAFAQVNLILKYPLLYYTMIGYRAGTSSEASIDGQIQMLMPMNEFKDQIIDPFLESVSEAIHEAHQE